MTARQAKKAAAQGGAVNREVMAIGTSELDKSICIKQYVDGKKNRQQKKEKKAQYKEVVFEVNESHTLVVSQRRHN